MNTARARKVAVLGGGVIGAGWAARFALMGWDVAVFDPDPEAARKLGEVLANARRSLPALSDVALPRAGAIRLVTSVEEAVRDAEWIQESVPEQLELKHRVLAQAQAACPADALIGSSTSGFKPSELQQGARDPAQILVAHPFNPVYLLPVVELVGAHATVERARTILQGIGMFPLHVRKEIDAHIADRLLESVWREALWLVRDDIATTQEIDDVIRFGFGLRWAQMGLFETYRIAGGEAGMAHFIHQFGPCLAWPWSRLTDVPELSEELVAKIASQSDRQSGAHSIRELERIRDDNLVAMMRALKGRGWGAGRVLREHDERLRPPEPGEAAVPFVSVQRTIPVDWTDYNGHMNEARYGQVFSDAADAVMRHIGADEAYVAGGLSYFTVDIHIRFQGETLLGDAIRVDSRVLEGQGKRLRLAHEMRHADGRLLASAEQLLIHVSLETRRACEPAPALAQRLARIAAAHAAEAPAEQGQR